MKSQRLEADSKVDAINRLMRDHLDITEEEVEGRLLEEGRRGMSLKDKWVYWSNRYILLRVLLAEFVVSVLEEGQELLVGQP